MQEQFFGGVVPRVDSPTLWWFGGVSDRMAPEAQVHEVRGRVLPAP